MQFRNSFFVNGGILATLIFLILAASFSQITAQNLFAFTLVILVVGGVFFFAIRKIIKALSFKLLVKKKGIVSLTHRTRLVLGDFSKLHQPRLVKVSFSKSKGFFKGEIALRVNSRETFSAELPAIEEYASKWLSVPNKALTTDTNQISLQIPKNLSVSTLEIEFNLTTNILDPTLKNALDVGDEEEIEILVRG